MQKLDKKLFQDVINFNVEAASCWNKLGRWTIWKIFTQIESDLVWVGSAENLLNIELVISGPNVIKIN